MFFANRAVNRLAVHTALQQLAWCMSGAFFGVYLLRAGLAPSVLFLASAGVLTLRFVLRPLVLLVAPRIGLRQTLVIGTLLSALQYPAVGLVHGADVTLVLFCTIGALMAADRKWLIEPSLRSPPMRMFSRRSTSLTRSHSRRWSSPNRLLASRRSLIC